MKTTDIRISLDRLVVTRVERVRVERTTGLEADIFEFSIPDPALEHTAAFKDTQGKKVEVKVKGAIRFTGFCDSAEFQMVPATRIVAEGRDWTGVAIDEVLDKDLARSLRGKTASQVMQAIASHFGWSSDITATTRVYGDYKAFTEGISIWEAVRDLTQKEGFDAYVTPEKKLVFRERKLPTETARIYGMPGSRAQVPASMSFHQDKTLSLALKVKVIGFDEKAKRRIVYTAESKLRNRPNYKLVTVVDYSLTSKGEVRARAEAELAEISKGLVTGELVVPVDNGVEPGQAIQIRGTGSAENGGFDGRYFVTSAVDEQAEGPGEFTTTVRFASKPLVTSQDITVGEEE